MDTASWLAEHFGLTGEAVIPLLFILVLCWGFIRIINGPDNPVEFWHFFASYNERAEKEYGDINSLGMMAGIVACLFVIVWTTYKTNAVDPWALGVCLVYLGGVKAFAAWLRMVAAKKYGAMPELPAAPPAPTKRELTTTTTDKLTTEEPAR
jgi:hypothetical protein